MSNTALDRQFHQAVLRKLYPPLPQSSQIDNNEGVVRTKIERSLNPAKKGIEVEPEEIIQVPEILTNVPPVDQAKTNVSDYLNGSGETVGQHVTRAQRKRIRKRKLKEAGSRSKRFIGPSLPDKSLEENFTAETTTCLDAEFSGQRSQAETSMSDTVSRFANPSEGLDSSLSPSHEKLKHRRRAKKINHESAVSIQREPSSRVFMAESSRAGFVLKHL